MASNTLTSTALLVSLNLLFFSLVSSTYVPCPPPPKKSPKPPTHVPKLPPPKKSPKPPTHVPKSPPPTHVPTLPPPTPVPKYPPPTTVPKYPPPTTVPKLPPPPPAEGKCPIDTLKLGVCANLLNGLVNIIVGSPENTPCCSLIQGLADIEAAVCLCTAIKANVLGINLNIAVDLSLLLNYCGKKVPSNFQCA